LKFLEKAGLNPEGTEDSDVQNRNGAEFIAAIYISKKRGNLCRILHFKKTWFESGIRMYKSENDF
jgi:hypothetical protein